MKGLDIMKNAVLKCCLIVVGACFCLTSSSQPSFGDENFGLAMVMLANENEGEAISYLNRSWSPNSRPVLERIRFPQGPYKYSFDFSDPVLWGFLAYIWKAGEDPRYVFLKDVYKRVSEDSPNADLGTSSLKQKN